jgi:hypothetical protein
MGNKKIRHDVLLTCAGIILWLQCSSQSATMMSEKELKKLDSRLQTVIAQEMPQSGLRTHSSRPDPVAVLEDGSHVYGVVIYTTEPDAVASVGVQVNAVLPKFVTARVTAEQLVQLAKLDVVQYIDTGRKESIQQKE